MGIALVSPRGSDGRRRSALGRVILLSGATMAAVAAPIVVSLRHQGPTTTTVITGDPGASPVDVGVGPLLNRRWIPMAGQDPVGDLLPDVVTVVTAGSGTSTQSPPKATDSHPHGDGATSTSGGCGTCDATPADEPHKAMGGSTEAEVAPAPITVVHPTTTRPSKAPTTPTTAPSASSTAPSTTGTTEGHTVPDGSDGSTTTTTPASTTVASTTSTVPVGSDSGTQMLPAVPAGAEVVEYRLEFSGGILWLRVSSSGLTLLDVVAKEPFGVDNVNRDQSQVRVRFRSETARQEIVAEFLADGRTKVTATTEPA